MEAVILIGLGLILIFVLLKNRDLSKRVKYNKAYVALFNEIVKEENDHALKDVNNYIASTDSIEFQNKGRIFKLFIELDQEIEYEQTLEQLDFKPLFYDGDKLKTDKIFYNSDSFVWVIATMARARKHHKQDVLDAVMAKLEVFDDILKHFVEYNVAKSAYKMFTEKDDRGVEFLKDLIEGNYAKLQYDKHLIGIYKKIAIALLAYGHEELDDGEKDDLRMLASSLVGAIITKDLDLYDEYGPVVTEEANAEVIECEETLEENTEEVKEENKD